MPSHALKTKPYTVQVIIRPEIPTDTEWAEYLNTEGTTKRFHTGSARYTTTATFATIAQAEKRAFRCGYARFRIRDGVGGPIVRLHLPDIEATAARPDGPRSIALRTPSRWIDYNPHDLRLGD